MFFFLLIPESDMKFTVSSAEYDPVPTANDANHLKQVRTTGHTGHISLIGDNVYFL